MSLPNLPFYKMAEILDCEYRRTSVPSGPPMNLEDAKKMLLRVAEACEVLNQFEYWGDDVPDEHVSVLDSMNDQIMALGHLARRVLKRF